MKPVPDVWEKARVNESQSHLGYTFVGEWNGRFVIRCPVLGSYLVVMTSNGADWREYLPGEPWEHVSVSVNHEQRCPTWEEMCWVKDQVWDAEECVVQFHPPKSEYVNQHPYVLHLWRCPTQETPRPPSICVGQKGGEPLPTGPMRAGHIPVVRGEPDGMLTSFLDSESAVE